MLLSNWGPTAPLWLTSPFGFIRWFKKSSISDKWSVFILVKVGSDFLSFLNHGLGKPHSLESSKGTNERGYYGVSLTANYRLIVKPNCENTNAETLKECKEVIIMGVKDYHGKNEKWLVPWFN